jgi:hypothetical protein
VAITRGPRSCHCYINGKQVGENHYQHSNAKTDFGSVAVIPGFKSALDEFRLYEKNLSAEEIKKLYADK